MSRGQPPPAPDSMYYGFNELDLGPVPDMTAPQMPADGTDGMDMMALLNNPLLAYGLDPFSMPIDSTAGSANPALRSHFDPPLDTPLSQPMGSSMLPSAPLAASAPLRDQLAPDGPTGQQFSVPSSIPGVNNSATTDFTKRRNWPAKVIEEMKDLLFVLDGNGRIKYASPSVTELVGYDSSELINLFLKDLIHPDDARLFVAEMNEAIASGESMRIFYRFKTKDGMYSIFEAVGHAHVVPPHFAPNSNSSWSPFCQAVFLISRRYPTKNARLLDTFLEHKVENERLRRRIASLRMEEETEEADAQRRWKQRLDSKSEMSRSEDLRTRGSGSTTAATGTSLGLGAAGFVDGCMPPPERPAAASSGALTRENLEGAVAGSRPDSLRDKMARYEQGSRAETIEMLTGLRYVDGERSRGAASGRSSPRQITGDAGITIPIGRESRAGEKKKKQKVVEEYVCNDCGTVDSPEWRKGPAGPKSLCNACGLRWAKKEKKRHMVNMGGATTSTNGGDQPMAGV